MAGPSPAPGLAREDIARTPILVALVLLGALALVPSASALDYTGTAKYDDGTPADGANVTVEVVDGNFQPVGEWSNVTNSTGHFNVSSITGNQNYFYKATVEVTDAGGNVTHTSKNAPHLDYFTFQSLGDVNYFLRDAVTLNLTAHDPTSTWETAENGSPVELSDYGTGLEALTDQPGNPYAYVNGTGNLAKANATGAVIAQSTNAVPNVTDPAALTYNGSGGYYAANTTRLVKFRNDSSAQFTLEEVENWSLSGESYLEVGGLEYRDGDVYVSAVNQTNAWVLDRIYTNNGTISRQTSHPAGDKRMIEFEGGKWYVAKNASGYLPGETWELKEYDTAFNPGNTWELPTGEEVNGFAKYSADPNHAWTLASINAGDGKGRARAMTLPDPTVKSFTYQVKDTKLGYPVASKFSSSVEQETLVLPANRNYGIEMHPTSAMPTNKALESIRDNASWKQDRKIDVRFNVSEEPKWISGYANTTDTAMGSPGFDNFTVVPFLLETGKNGVPMTFKQDPHQFPRNLSALRNPQEADQFNASQGHYNITQLGSAETSDILLFYAAYNATEDQHYGGFSNLSIDATQSDVTGHNITLRPLKGTPGNLTTQTFDANLQMKNVDVPTALKTFRVQNGSGSPKPSHVEFRVDYSSQFSTLDTAFTWLGDTGDDGNFTIPVLNTSIEEVSVYPSGGEAPQETAIDRTRLESSPVTINVSMLKPGSPDGSAFNDIEVDMYRSDADTDVPYPDQDKSLIPKGEKDLQKFNPLTALLGGGDISFRMKRTSNNITVHYVKTDLLASGPPDALFDSNSSDEQSGGTLAQAWRFGSSGPEIYDHVLIGMPYNSTRYPDDQDLQVRISKLYDEDWNVVWNISQNTTADLPERYADYNQGDYKNYIDSSLDPVVASKTDENMRNSIAYVDTDRDMLWMEIPHFSGVSPQISAVEPSTDTGPSTGGGGVSSPGAIRGDAETVFNKYTVATVTPGEPAEVRFQEDAPIRGLSVSSTTTVFDPSFSAAEHTSKPDGVDAPPGAVRRYVSVTTSMTDDQLDSAEIAFTVERDWLDENGLAPGDVTLSRWHDDQWQDLETRVTSEDGDVAYAATTPGFSVFAVSGAAAEAAPTPQPTETETPTGETTPGPTATEDPAEPTPTPGLAAPLAATGLAAAAHAARRRRG